MARRRKVRIKWFRLAAIFIFGYFIYLFVGQQNQLSAIESENKAARQRLEQAVQENASLIEERNKLNTPAYIEKLAREELGLVKPGEVPYIPAAKN
ncbi:MAG: septum formation initiator family protein [Veillonellaceae bacterium]|jgi:cell division protein FtsL|nr:septum formation initiator family protein [Veillonellaceae bacterium]